jgi:hypothetical protein
MAVQVAEQKERKRPALASITIVTQRKGYRRAVSKNDLNVCQNDGVQGRGLFGRNGWLDN